MNLHNRLKKLEVRDGDAGECPLCRGMPRGLVRAEFENGDEPVEIGRCRCGCTGGPEPRLYRLPNRELFDGV